MKAVVFLADGYEECEALITVDILRRAGVEQVRILVGEEKVQQIKRAICYRH